MRAPEYSGHLHVAPVSSTGTFGLKRTDHFLSTALCDELIGLEEVGDGVWSIVYYSTLLAKKAASAGSLKSFPATDSRNPSATHRLVGA